MRTHARKLILIACLALGLALPANASAASIDFTVVNPSGTPQAAVAVKYYSPNAGPSGHADAYGRYTSVSSILPGDTLYFTRDTSTGCAAPEGPGGISYTVPNPAPAAATIVLPSSSGAPFAPVLSDSERGLIGLINQKRVEQGLQPLTVSLVLNDAADRYSNHQNTVGSFGHCVLGSPKSRGIDIGYPARNPNSGYSDPTEVRAGANTAYSAFTQLMNSPGHYATLMHPDFRHVGTGQVNTTWTVKLAKACTWPAGCERGGFTADVGDASLADGDPSGAGNGNKQGSAKQRCAKKRGSKKRACRAKARCKKISSKKKRTRCLRKAAR